MAIPKKATARKKPSSKKPSKPAAKKSTKGGPAKSKAHKVVPRVWKTRPVGQYERPKAPRSLARQHNLMSAVALADGTIVGIEESDTRDSTAIRIDKSGARIAISPESVDASSIVAKRDGPLVLVLRDSRILELDATTPLPPRIVFEGHARISTLVALADGYFLIACPGEVHLLAWNGDKLAISDSAVTEPSGMALVKVLGGGRWVLVYPVTLMFLFAIVRGKLQLVETFVQRKRGISMGEGPPYLYTSGKNGFEEILDLDEVHATL